MSSRPPTDHNMGLLALAYLLVAAGLGVAALAIAELLDPPPPITATIVQTDFPICFTAKPPPLLQPPASKYDYRLGVGRKDGGTV